MSLPCLKHISYKHSTRVSLILSFFQARSKSVLLHTLLLSHIIGFVTLQEDLLRILDMPPQKLLSPVFKHFPKLIRPYPPFPNPTYKWSTSFSGSRAPYTGMIFLVLGSRPYISFSVYLIIPAPRLSTSTAHVLTAWILFFPFCLDLRNNLSPLTW